MTTVKSTTARRTRTATKPPAEMVIRRGMCDECGALESIEVDRLFLRPEVHRFAPCAYCGYMTGHALLLDNDDPEVGDLEARLRAQVDEQRLGIEEGLRELEALGADVRLYAEDEAPNVAIGITRYLDTHRYAVRHRLLAEPYENAMKLLAQVGDRIRNEDALHEWYVGFNDDDVPAVSIAWTCAKAADD